MMKKIKCILFSFFVMMSLMLIQMQVFATPEISKSKVTISVGSSTHLKLSGVTSKISWKSSKPSVATVSSSGKVTGKGIGTAKITATYKGKKYNCMVTVKLIDSQFVGL
ncbi:MAG: Ig domain-containing protein [Lachnospiraceae bacterium]